MNHFALLDISLFGLDETTSILLLLVVLIYGILKEVAWWKFHLKFMELAKVFYNHIGYVKSVEEEELLEGESDDQNQN